MDYRHNVTESRAGAAREWARRNGEWVRDGAGGGWVGGNGDSSDESVKDVTLDKARFCAQHCFPSISLAQGAAIPGGECVSKSPALQQMLDEQKHKQA